MSFTRVTVSVHVPMRLCAFVCVCMKLIFNHLVCMIGVCVRFYTGLFVCVSCLQHAYSCVVLCVFLCVCTYIVYYSYVCVCLQM